MRFDKLYLAIKTENTTNPKFDLLAVNIIVYETVNTFNCIH